MFTWICSFSGLRRVFLGLTCLALAGCETGDGSGIFRKAPESVVVAGKSVVIAGPPGYCVDSAATRDTATGAFVLLGSCASIANSVKLPAPQTPGLLTASVSGTSNSAISASLNRLEMFFTSEPGRAALARDGNTGSVRILDTRSKGNAFYIHLRDTSENNNQGISQDYWRGLFDVRGRIVTVSVVGFERKPMSSAVGLATLDAFAKRIRAENPMDEGPTPAALYGRLLQ